MLLVYLIILLALAALVLLPYERVALRRFITLRKIESLCREKEINFKVLNRSYIFSRNKKDEFDFIMRIENTVIPVKFYSAADKYSSVILDQTGKLSIKRKYREAFSRKRSATNRVIEKKGALPIMKIRKNIVGERYNCYPVFLNEPPFSSVFVYDEKGNVKNIYDSNARIAGCHWLDKATLLDLISASKSSNIGQNVAEKN